MKLKTIEVSFSISGWVKQQIEVPADMDVTEIQRKLNAGELFTTIQEGGELVSDSMSPVGNITYVNPETEYFDFEVREL
jgi:hypothetical protein